VNVTNKNIITQQCMFILVLRISLQYPYDLTVTRTNEVKVSYRLMPSSATNFVGRADYLSKLEQIFTTGGSTNDSRPISVLCAIGGMGKSQIGLKFAETRRHL
jgi:hypothetical protein